MKWMKVTQLIIIINCAQGGRTVGYQDIHHIKVLYQDCHFNLHYKDGVRRVRVAIMKETPVLGAAINLVLIIVACGPDSIPECISFWLNHTHLPSVIIHRLIGCINAFIVTGFEVRGPFFRATCLMATRIKATTPKCASGKVPGNTTAL